MMPRHLLIDGDVLVYQFANSCQVATRWERDLWTWHAKEPEGKAKLANYLDELLERLEADCLTVVLSDLDGNFRNNVYPPYKHGRRAGEKRPLLFKPLREFLFEEYGAVVFPNLEGDDTLGILATDPQIYNVDELIVCSIDKDMLTIPASHYNWTKPEKGIVCVTREEAAHNHLLQALTGDSTDGYPGCPGIGPVRAKRLFDTHGWTWETLLMAYAKAELDEEFALTQARCAFILHYPYYNQESGKVTMWSPETGGM